MVGHLNIVDGNTYISSVIHMSMQKQLVYKEKVFYFFIFFILIESNSSITTLPTYPTYFNVTNISHIDYGHPPIFAQNPPSTPWYIQYLPELILIAGIALTVLTFYFSPGLRGAVKRLFLRK